jgi:hypothetical protein
VSFLHVRLRHEPGGVDACMTKSWRRRQQLRAHSCRENDGECGRPSRIMNGHLRVMISCAFGELDRGWIRRHTIN